MVELNGEIGTVVSGVGVMKNFFITNGEKRSMDIKSDTL